MTTTFKRATALVLSLFVLIAFASCGDPATNSADITSKWTFDHAVYNGSTVQRSSLDQSELPYFSSDGLTFKLSVVSSKEYIGTVQSLGDGNYTLTNPNVPENKLKVQITGNTLTVYVGDSSTLVFFTE